MVGDNPVDDCRDRNRPQASACQRSAARLQIDRSSHRFGVAASGVERQQAAAGIAAGRALLLVFDGHLVADCERRASRGNRASRLSIAFTRQRCSRIPLGWQRALGQETPSWMGGQRRASHPWPFHRPSLAGGRRPLAAIQPPPQAPIGRDWHEPSSIPSQLRLLTSTLGVESASEKWSAVEKPPAL